MAMTDVYVLVKQSNLLGDTRYVVKEYTHSAAKTPFNVVQFGGAKQPAVDYIERCLLQEKKNYWFSVKEEEYRQ